MLNFAARETSANPFVDLYTFKGEPRPNVRPQLNHVVRLVGGHDDSVVRDVWLHQEVPFILTCGEDGQVRLWEEVSTPTIASSHEESRSLNSQDGPNKKYKKRKKKEKEEEKSVEDIKKRYKPY